MIATTDELRVARFSSPCKPYKKYDMHISVDKTKTTATDGWHCRIFINIEAVEEVENSLI